MKDPMARASFPVSSHPSDEESQDHEPGKNGDSVKVAPIPIRPINSFTVPPDDDPSVLLGNRYLCRGDGLVLASSSGMGKSSIVIQAAVTWCFNKPFMGIQPNGCLRSLIIQAEDSDGDIGEVWESVCHMMELTPEQGVLAGERVVVVTDRINRGPFFEAELKRQTAAAKYDLVWINPLAAFITGDITTQEETANFLRRGLNQINTPPSFGYIVIQHTVKPNRGKNADNKEPKWFEVMYDMAGSYDLIGWARCIISLRPTDQIGDFNLVLAKRGPRAGVTKKVPQGTGYRLENTLVIPIKHCNRKMAVAGINRELSVIYWETREEIAAEKAPDRPSGRPKQNSVSEFLSIFPVGIKNARGVNELLREALRIRHIAKGTLYSIINDALAKRLVVCDSSNVKAPSYYVQPPVSDLAEPDFLAGQ